jgi:outer membrane protein OmpA-like peptidoglycan-associated protein
VKAALTHYYVIAPENLATVGLGERYLKIWTPEAEEENRRVTVRRVTPLVQEGTE